jgi:zinc protease
MKFVSNALTLFALAFGFQVSIVAQQTMLAGESHSEQYKLPNGLQVILHEDHRLPIVAVNIWYHVGPANERAGRTGFAHLFEHMMLQRSGHLGDQSPFQFLESIGATHINATTAFDRTNYFETVPTNQLETALWLESDRMGFLLDSLNRTRLTNQRDVVQNERRKQENTPYDLVDEELYHQLFPQTHPYYAAIMGSHADIEAARLADIREFFTEYYVPNNASLAIVGDFDPAATRQMIEKYFGPLPSGPAVSVAPVVTPAITAERRVVVTDTVQLPKVILGWLTPPAYKPGDAEANMAALILGGGKSSRFYRELVYKQQIAQSASCSNDSLALASVFSCEFLAKPGITPERLEAEVDKILAEFMQGGPTSVELERARNTIETNLILGVDQLGDGTERQGELDQVANRLNHYSQYTGVPDYLPKDLARYDAATQNSVHEIARNTLNKNQRVVIYGVSGKKVIHDVPRSPEDTDANVKIEPAHSAAFEASQLWRATPPKPGPEPTLTLLQPTIFTLTNGLTVHLVERHEQPVVTMQLVVLAGSGSNPSDRPGLASLTADLLTEGSTTLSAEQIAAEAARMGTVIDSSSDANAVYLRLTLRSKYAAPGLNLIADAALHPLLSETDLERLVADRRVDLLQQKDNSWGMANRVGLLNLYGQSSPYGYNQLGSEAALRHLTRNDIADFYARNYGPKDSLLELTGDLTTEQAHKLAETAFGKWNSAATPTEPPAAPTAPARHILIVDRPGSPMTTLLVLAPGQARNATDYPDAAVMNAALGGLFSSRINMNLREEHGYAYYTSSAFLYYRGIGPFLFRAQVQADVTAPAVEQLFLELDRIHTQPLTNDELSRARSSLIRSLVSDFESTNSINTQMANLWLFQLPPDYFGKLPARIEAVTSADAQQAAARYIRPQNLLLIVVGDKSKIEAGLKDLKLGPVETWTEPSAVPAKEPTK